MPWNWPFARRTGAPAGTAPEPVVHQIVLAEQAISYVLQRAQRRSIGFIVGPDGLQVKAPCTLPRQQIDQALHRKAAWILRKLHEQQQRTRQQQQQPTRIAWQDGASIPFLGQPCILTLRMLSRAGARGSCVLDAAGGRLNVALPLDASASQIQKKVQAWLQQQARSLFAQRCQHYAPLLGVQYSRLALTSARTRWGSASANGAIRLHWRLMHFELNVIDYVVVHELAHLKEMNHSPRFWAVVGLVLPDYAHWRKKLKQSLLNASG